MQNLKSVWGLVASGLRFRLLLLVVVTCAPLAGLTLHTAWDDRRRAEANWTHRAQKLTQLANRQEEQVIGETRQLLLAVAESAPVRSGNRRGCKELLGELIRSYPRYANFGVIQTNGELLATGTSPRGPVSQADRDFFRRALDSQAFVIGDFPAGPVESKPVLNFGCPVFDRLGQFRGVVFAALDLVWFNRFGSELPAQLPQQATWIETDAKGRIIARFPAPGEWIGQSLPEGAFLKTVLQRKNGVLEFSDLDGVKRFYAFAPRHSQIGPGNFTTILGIPRRVLFAGADRALVRNLSWFGLAAGLALTAGWIGSNLLVLRPVKALVHSTARLTSGDLSARTGLPHGRDELGQLTLTFDLMAQALEQREVERRRANQKLQVVSHRLVEAQETERRHIARELHDEIGQSLTVAEMNLQAALKTSRSAPQTRRLKESIQAVGLVLEQVQDLSLNLRPSMLDDLGLEAALRWYTHRQASLAGIKAEIQFEPLERRLDPMIETECFRVAQEAMTNLVRHARASVVAVRLTKQDGMLHLTVRDDGIGFDVAATRKEAMAGASLGLLSMEERATLAGGGLAYVSALGQGTEVQAWFPLRWQLASA